MTEAGVTARLCSCTAMSPLSSCKSADRERELIRLQQYLSLLAMANMNNAYNFMEFSYRKKYAEAARILESITWRYGHNRWTVLENELVIKHAKCLRELGDTIKYAQACLTLLRNMDDLKDDEKLHYSNELFSTVTSKELKQEIYHEFAPMFTVKV